jgi:glycosyltransferase involved in cell wall biosynthesis
MRILILDQFSELGGGQRCLLEAVEGFAARGWQVHAAVPRDGPLSDALKPYVQSVAALPCGPFTSGRKDASDAVRFAVQLPAQRKLVSRIVRTANIDVLYVNGSRVLPAAALGRRGRPVVFHSHWAVPQRSSALLAERALRFSGARVVASSKFVARSFGGRISADRIRVVYNGVRAERRPETLPPLFLKNAGLPRRVMHIGVLGRIAPEKGQLEFVRAARVVAQSYPGVRFSICGAPMFSSASYFDQVKQEAEGHVAFPGWTNNVREYLGSVDLLAVPSAEIDNIPRVILEAFSECVPVVAFGAGGIPELIRHGETGLLAEQHSAESLAKTMLFAIEHLEVLSAIAARARTELETRYTLERFQSEVCDVLQSAVHQRRTPLHRAGVNAPA